MKPEELAKTIAKELLALNVSIHHIRNENKQAKIKARVLTWIGLFSTDDVAIASKIERILTTPEWIKCLRCDRKSYNPSDIADHFCPIHKKLEKGEYELGYD